MSPISIGLMSGTSADSVSAAAGQFENNKFKLLGRLDIPFPPDIPPFIRKGPRLTASELSLLNFRLGEIFGKAAHQLLNKLRLPPRRVACIGSHGQTIYHGPHDQTPNTLQIGEPAVIRKITGIPVVSNFREMDIAAGGEGAPLIPFFDQYFFGDGPTRALQNIGGIANVTVVGKNIKTPIAFDSGPGNCLMDEAMRLISNGKRQYDDGGRLAERGVIQLNAVDRLMKDPYFLKPPPKSTGLEKFNRALLLSVFGKDLIRKPGNVLATLNYFTCLTIVDSYRNFIFPLGALEEVIVSGGGARNKRLMKNLAALLSPIPVTSIERYGIPPLAKEPLAFAFLGLRAFQGKINHWPETTGALKAGILGKISR